jgi:hypothetical protein
MISLCTGNAEAGSFLGDICHHLLSLPEQNACFSSDHTKSGKAVAQVYMLASV